MGSELLEKLLARPVGWLADHGPAGDIAISSRIRLARNLRGHFFPVHASDEQLSEVAELVRGAALPALGDNCMRFRMGELTNTERMLLFERRLVSRELFKRPAVSELLLAENECAGIMVNEEDHLRLQALLPGFQLDKVYAMIDHVDCALSEHLDIAYDPNLGYLTCCPTNLGTGMRASVMLHLPALVLTRRIGAAVQGINKLNFTVRGLYGEGSDNRGNLFQVSNQSTLGESEPEIIARLSRVIAKLIDYETSARNLLADKQRNFLCDRVGRAYGTLSHAYFLAAEEAASSLSMIRLGVDMGMFSNVDIHTVNDLFVRINPAHLRYSSPPDNTPDSAGKWNTLRATMVRNALRQPPAGE